MVVSFGGIVDINLFMKIIQWLNKTYLTTSILKKMSSNKTSPQMEKKFRTRAHQCTRPVSRTCFSSLSCKERSLTAVLSILQKSNKSASHKL